MKMPIHDLRARRRPVPLRRPQPKARSAFDWLFVVLSGWLVGGAYLDGWAHIHVPQLETFFTPWHAILYSGFLVVALLTVGTLVRNHRRGVPWRRALPAGYELSLVGVIVFLIAGVGDMIWHTIFGIEANVDALLSPTHLMLVLGASLMVTGPLRAGWRRSGAQGQSWLARFPAVISLALLLSVFTFFTQYAHPWANLFAGNHYRPSSADLTFYRQALGVASILLQSSILMGLVLLAMRARPLPLGALTLVFTLNAVLMALMRDTRQIIPGAVVAGIAADALLWLLRPSLVRLLELRLFAFLAPAILYGLYFLTLALTEGIWWSVHLWAGSIVMAGIVGWLVSYLVVPPAAVRAPEESSTS